MIKKLLLVILILVLVVVFYLFDLGQYLSLSFFAEQKASIDAYYQQHPLAVMSSYFAIYTLVFALALPVGAVLSLVGGALFGLWWGTLLVSFASTLGSVLAFLMARTLLRDWVEQRLGRSLQRINKGIEKEGAFYLFTLRLVPLFPPAAINLAMGLTRLPLLTFYWVSQLGMLAGTIVYINAGTELGQINPDQGLLSPGLVFAFVLLGIFPWIAKFILARIKDRNALRGYPRPARFDANLIVIGAGAAGLVSAYIAAAVKARVILIEKGAMGGDCLNTGCVPSKALIRSARQAHAFKRGPDFGLESVSGRVNFEAVMNRVRQAIKQIEPHDSTQRYQQLGVECLQGQARLVSPWEVEVNNRRLTARKIIIASGGSPFVPDLPGLEDCLFYTSDTIWQLNELPARWVVLGGGPIGCELAQAFARLGAKVTLVSRNSRLLPKEDEDVSLAAAEAFRTEGIEVLLGYQPIACRREAEGNVLEVVQGNVRHELSCDALLLAVGRQARVQGFGLEELGVTTRSDGSLEVNEYLQTTMPTLYACGDVTGPYLFTHVASHQAWYAAVNALFGPFRRFRVDYSVIPWATFIDPEVARVGLNEQEAQARGIAYEVTRYDLDDLDRAIADGEARGFIKVLTVPGKDRILGATIMGYHAGELISEFVLAMKHRIGLNKLLATIHIYPTWTEANKYVAGQWKRNHAPRHVLNWVEKFHRLRRGGH